MKTLKDSLNESLNEAKKFKPGNTVLDFVKWYTQLDKPFSNDKAMEDMFDNGSFDWGENRNAYTYDEHTDMVRDFKRRWNEKIEVINKKGEVSFKLGKKTLTFSTKELYESLNEAKFKPGKTLLDFVKFYTQSDKPFSDAEAMEGLYDNGAFDAYDDYKQMTKDFEKHQNDKIDVDVDKTNGYYLLMFDLNGKDIEVMSTKNYK